VIEAKTDFVFFFYYNYNIPWEDLMEIQALEVGTLRYIYIYIEREKGFCSLDFHGRHLQQHQVRYSLKTPILSHTLALPLSPSLTGTLDPNNPNPNPNPKRVELFWEECLAALNLRPIQPYKR
jgi:hypothetical protein